MTQTRAKPLGITDTVLRDSHQSLLATRMKLDDMIPAMEMLDEIGYWSLEVWGGATFDSCMRFLNEDPWERLRVMKKRMPKTRLQMLLRGQNIVGYRHYADDIVERFVAKARDNGMDVFRIFDALNDIRNMETAIRYRIPLLAYTRLSVVDLNGREVAVLADGMRAGGDYEARWDGQDGSGNPMPSGLYLYRIQVGEFRTTRKLFLMK